MPIYEVDLEPYEPLMFGDNRSARAGVDHLVRDQEPSPLTLHGALGQSIVSMAGDGWPGDVLGTQEPDILEPLSPTAALLGYCLRTAAGEPYFPRPLHLRCEPGAGHDPLARPVAHDLLSPQEVTSETSSRQPALPGLVMASTPQAEEEIDEYSGTVYLSRSALGDVLCGEVPAAGLHPAARLFRPEPRPGIAVDNHAGTVMEGAFFTRPYRRFAPPELDPDTGLGGFTAWFETLSPLAAGREPSMGFVGGDRRRARLSFERVGDARDELLADVCRRVQRAADAEDARGFLLYLVTPALARCGLPHPEGVAPLAAVLGKPAWVSGWSTLRRQPRPIEVLMPAGSVVFYRWPEDADRSAWVRRLWLSPWAEPGAAAGFGRSLVGVWR